MSQQIIIVLLGTLPALFVLLAPFWVMVYFDQRAMQREDGPGHCATPTAGSARGALPKG